MYQNISRRLACVVYASLPFCAGVAFAQEGPLYEVRVTNLTRGQRFTPVLAVTHQEGFGLFRLGSPASPQLRTLAEEGNTGPLMGLLNSMTDQVREAVSSPAPPPLDRLTGPGQSVTVMIRGVVFSRVFRSRLIG